MVLKIQEGVGAVVRNDGVIWAVFISLVVVFGFLTVVAISESNITSQHVDTPAAAVGNMTVQEVDLTIVPVEE